MKRLILLVVLSGLLLIPTAAQDENIFTSQWSAQYFNNPYLSGNPSLQRMDNGVGFDWGYNAPDISLPSDNFSVRWSKGGYLAAGTYRFIVTADLGFRLYIDGQAILDTWEGGASAVTIGRDIYIESGNHNLQVDYRDFEGTAFIYLDWGFAPNGQSALAPSASGNTATVTAYTLNLRSAPQVGDNVIGRLRRGEEYPVIGRSSDGRWLQLSLPNAQSGWASAAYLSESGSQAVTSSNNNLSGLTLRSNVRLRLRSAPNDESDILTILLPNEVVEIIGRSADGAWWQVNDNGTVGWLSARFVTLSPDVNPDAIRVTN